MMDEEDQELWECLNCYAENDAEDYTCWKCGEYA